MRNRWKVLREINHEIVELEERIGGLTEIKNLLSFKDIEVGDINKNLTLVPREEDNPNLTPNELIKEYTYVTQSHTETIYKKGDRELKLITSNKN